MHTNKNAAFIVSIALSMLILAYITFITVYEQILSQNNGFFNVIIFGVVLILVFIFITLFARIVTLKPDSSETTVVLKILVYVGILGIFALFVFSRIRFNSSILPDESVIFKTANYIRENRLSEGGDIKNQIIRYPSEYIYGTLLSFVFKICGATKEILIYTNISMMLLVAVFVFLIVRLLAGEAFATLAIILTMFMPNNAFLVYSYNTELFTAVMFLVTLYLFLLLIYKRFKSVGLSAFISVLCGIFGGITLSCEPVMYITIIVLSMWVFSAKRHKTFCAVLPPVISVFVLIIIDLLKSVKMKVSLFEVIIGQLMCFVPVSIRTEDNKMSGIKDAFSTLCSRLNNPSKYLNDNFYFLSDLKGVSLSTNQAIWLKLADQLIYIFMLVLCVLCIVYVIRVTYDKIVPSFGVLTSLFLCQVLGGVNDVNYFYFVLSLIIIGSTTIYYMYLNHHPDYAIFITNLEIKKDNDLRLLAEGGLVIDEEKSLEENGEATENEETINEEELLRSRALVFVGENENLYEQIKEEERQNRQNDGIVAKVIKTTMTEEGEYDSVEENIEFFDEPDSDVSVKKVHEVIAIPNTRPVEVVKPVLADEYDQHERKLEYYYDTISEPVYKNEPTISTKNETAVSNQNTAMDFNNDNKEDANKVVNNESLVEEETKSVARAIREEDYFDEPDNYGKGIAILAEAEAEGFIFRRQEDIEQRYNDDKNSKLSKDDKLRQKKQAEINRKKAKEDALAAKKKAKEDAIAKKQQLKEEKLRVKEEKKALKSKKSNVNSNDFVSDMNNPSSINPDEVLPGEPLPNPLELPKPHESKKMDYDV